MENLNLMFFLVRVSGFVVCVLMSLSLVMFMKAMYDSRVNNIYIGSNKTFYIPLIIAGILLVFSLTLLYVPFSKVINPDYTCYINGQKVNKTNIDWGNININENTIQIDDINKTILLRN